MAPPLSHHRIFELLPPFTQRGWAVDLAATARLERRLAFKPRLHEVPGIGAVEERWLLDDPGDGSFRLVRRSLPAGEAPADGLVAELQAAGDDIDALICRIEAVAVASQFDSGDGFVAAFTQVLHPAAKGAGRGAAKGAAKGPAKGAATPPAPVLTTAQVQFRGGAAAGVRLSLGVSRVGAIYGELRMLPAEGRRPELPEDLFAVLGGDWSRLSPAVGGGWRTVLRLPRREPARSAAARRLLPRAAAHVAATLAAPPQHFHDRHRLARWRFALRRAVPLAVCIGLIGAALAVPLLDLPMNSVWRMLIFNAPPLLLVAFFALREMPRFEIPPLPARLKADAWGSARG